MKTKFFFNNNQKTKLIKMDKKVETPSTLLIPEEWIPFLEKQIQKHGDLSAYLNYLLTEYQIFIQSEAIPKTKRVKTLYQSKGQNLEQMSFRPSKEDWFKLKLLREAFGYSISYFFVLLMGLDKKELFSLGRIFLEGVVETMLSENFLHGGLELRTEDFQFYRIFSFF
jgi:hypothetical protein